MNKAIEDGNKLVIVTPHNHLSNRSGDRLSRPAGGLGNLDEVSGMLKWIAERVVGPASGAVGHGEGQMPPLSRRELSDLFSDELAKPVLQKRTAHRRKNVRQPMAGRRPEHV